MNIASLISPANSMQMLFSYIKIALLLIAALGLIRSQKIATRTPCVCENFSIWYCYAFLANYLALTIFIAFLERGKMFHFSYNFSKLTTAILFFGSSIFLQNILAKILERNLYADFSSRVAESVFSLRNSIISTYNFLNLLDIYLITVFVCSSPLLVLISNSLLKFIIIAFCILQILFPTITYFLIENIEKSFKKKIASQKCRNFLMLYVTYFGLTVLYLVSGLLLQGVAVGFDLQSQQTYTSILKNINVMFWMLQNIVVCIIFFDFRKFLYD